MGHCTYMAPSKSAVKSGDKPVLGSDVSEPIQSGPGGYCKKNKDCLYTNGCCLNKKGVCGAWVDYGLFKLCLNLF